MISFAHDKSPNYSEDPNAKLSPLKRIKNSSFRKVSTLQQKADQNLSTIDQSISQTDDHFLSKENKFIRFKVNDLLAYTHIQMILIKIWKLLLELQYENDKKVNITVHNCVTYNLDLKRTYKDGLNLYEKFIPLLKRGYGSYFDSDYYIIKRPEYAKDLLNFERFSFDCISLVGTKLLLLLADQFETIIRKAFHCITFLQEGKLKLLDFEQIESIWDTQKVEDFEAKKVLQI